MFSTVYKVVRCIPEVLISAVADGEWCYVYPVGEEICPRVGYFYAFWTEGQALAFRKREILSLFSNNLQVWEAEAETVDEPEPLMADVCSLEDNGVWFWEHYENFHGRYPFTASDGTVWCKSIQLQRRMA